MFSITLYTKQLGVRENNALYFFMRGSILNSLVNFAVCLDPVSYTHLTLPTILLV